MNRKTIKRIYNAAIIMLLLCGIGYVCSRFVHPGRVEYTDDARVERHISPVNTRVQGFVREIRFEEYQHVNKGDTLVLIEDAEYRYRLAQAEADLERARSGKSVDAASLNTTASNVTVAEAGIEEARVNMENALADVGRYEALLAKDAVTRKQYEDVQTRYKAAKARYEQVSRQKKSTELVGKELTGRLGQSSASVRLAEAALELARLQLSYTVITAPCSGRVGRKDIHEGQLLQPGQLAVRIVDDSNVWIMADYRETQMKHISVGNKVRIKADAIPGVEFSGEVQSISSATGSAWTSAPIRNTSGNFVKVEQRVPVRIVLTGEEYFPGRSRSKSGSSGREPSSGCSCIGQDLMDQLMAGLNVETEVLY